MSIQQLSRTACIAVTNIEPFCHHEAAEAVGDLRQALNDVVDSQGQAVLEICEAFLRTTARARGHRSKTMKTYTITLEHNKKPTQTVALTGFIASLRVAKALANTRQGVVLMRDNTTGAARSISPQVQT